MFWIRGTSSRTSQTQATEGTLKGVYQLLYLTILEGREGTHG